MALILPLSGGRYEQRACRYVRHRSAQAGSRQLLVRTSQWQHLGWNHAHVEAFAGLLGAVIGGMLVLVGDFGRRRADTRQSQVQRLANAAVEFSVPIAHLVADIRDARDRHEPTARIPSRGRRYEASIRLYVTPGSDELRGFAEPILEAYWKLAKLPDDDPNIDQVTDEYFKAQIAFERKVRSIIQRGRIIPEKALEVSTHSAAS